MSELVLMQQLQEATKANKEHMLSPHDMNTRFKSLQGTNSHSAEVSCDDHYNLYHPESMRATNTSPVVDTGGRSIESTIFSPDR